MFLFLFLHTIYDSISEYDITWINFDVMQNTEVEEAIPCKAKSGGGQQLM